MSETLLSSRNLAFELYEVLDAEGLTQRERFAEHSRETFDAAIGTARSIAENLFAPHNRKNDEHEPQYVDGAAVLIPEVKPAVDAFLEAGFLNATREFEVGGMQLPNLLSQACFAHFQSANAATTSYPFLTMGAANLIESFGSAEQKARFLQPMIDGRFFGTMALTEPHAGSSLSDLRTKAEPASDGSYRIKGNKIFISGGDHPLSENIVHMVLARLPDAPPGVKGISLFIVPKFLVNADGSLGARNDVILAGLFHKMGWRGTTSTALNFGDKGECVGYLVGKPHAGLSYMFQMMNEARIGVGMGAVMLGYAGYLYSLEYARERPQGRVPDSKDPNTAPVPIIQHADVKRMLLTQKAYVEGAFDLGLYAARLFDDTTTLETLPARELAAGLAEVIKYGAVIDLPFFEWIEANIGLLVARDKAALAYAIARSCEIKADVVRQDEREGGLRAILNFGHTFGHAIEAGMGYGQWLHGEAVGCGMVMAADLSQRMGLVDAATVERVRALVAAAGLPVKAPDLGTARWLELMEVDKKNEGGAIKFILMKPLGAPSITNAPQELLLATLAASI